MSPIWTASSAQWSLFACLISCGSQLLNMHGCVHTVLFVVFIKEDTKSQSSVVKVYKL